MKYVWIAGNGVTVVSTIVCTSYLYRFRWQDRSVAWPLLSALIFGATALITGAQFVFPEILSALRRDWGALSAGEWWRLITPLFVQPQGWIQCSANAFFLLAFVPLAERIYGPKLLALYFVPGIIGQVVNYSWDPTGGGSSTAAFGVMGGLLVFVIRHRRVVPRAYGLLASTAICAAVALSLAGDGHGPSLLAGALVASMFRDSPLPALKERPNKAIQATCEDTRA